MERVATDEDVLPSREALRAARQLYVDAQAALVAVEAFDLCVSFADGVRSKLRMARSMHCDMRRIKHGWLAAFEGDGERFLLAPASRSALSDEGLWALAHSIRSLRALLRDDAGRDYLRRTLTTDRCLRLQRGMPFRLNEADRLLSTIDATQIDAPGAFVDALLKARGGRTVQGLWVETLTTEVFEHVNWKQDHPTRLTRSDRYDLRDDLLKLCIVLQHLSPQHTIDSLDRSSRLAIRWVMLQGLLEIGLSRDELRAERVDELVDDLLWRRPPRYLTHGSPAWPLPPAYASSRRQWTPWDDLRPVHDPWAEL